MKNIHKKFYKVISFISLIATACIISVGDSRLWAVSVIEPFRPGVAVSETGGSAHSLSLSVLSSEKYFEIPFHIFYGITDDLELETKWGFIYNSPESGMSDMKFSIKYNFKYFDKYSIIVSDKGDRAPGISAEAGISLPTGDHTKGLGEGGVGIIIGWNIRQIFEKDIMGYLGLSAAFNNRELMNDPLKYSSRVFSYAAGARYFYNNDITFTTEIKGFNNYFSKAAGGSSDFRQELYLAPGIFYKGDKIPISSASVLIGLSSEARKILLYAEKKF